MSPICYKLLSLFYKRRKRRENYIQQNNRKKNKNKNNAVAGIIIGVAAICILGFFVVFTVTSPSNKYKKAISLMEKGKYEEAINIFKLLGDYEDTKE